MIFKKISIDHYNLKLDWLLDGAFDFFPLNPVYNISHALDSHTRSRPQGGSQAWSEDTAFVFQ